MQICSSSALPLPMSYPSTLSGTGLATGPVPSQHLSVHSCPQPPISLEELANWSGYPAMVQSHARNAAALQQGYQDGSVFHDSLAGMHCSLPQLKGGASRSSLPQSDANLTSYGGFGTCTNFLGGYLHDFSTTPTPTGSAVGYDVLHSQYQERNNFTVLQQVKAIGSLCFCMNFCFTRYYATCGSSL